MHFVPFNKSPETKIEALYLNEGIDTLSVETKYGYVYHGCSIRWEQGWTRSAEFDNYRFNHGNGTIFPEDVACIAFEDSELEQFKKDNPEGE